MDENKADFFSFERFALPLGQRLTRTAILNLYLAIWESLKRRVFHLKSTI